MNRQWMLSHQGTTSSDSYQPKDMFHVGCVSLDKDTLEPKDRVKVLAQPPIPQDSMQCMLSHNMLGVNKSSHLKTC